MAMRRLRFVNNNFYHIYNRGVEKRKIFLDKKDYFRFIHNLYEFNDTQLVNIFHRLKKNTSDTSGNRITYSRDKPRKLLVEIICYCLIPNHFHLLLKQLKDRGISRFMQKLGVGYTLYFNQKYERSGVLFQGKFKAVPINNDIQLTHTSSYIHLNPLDLIQPNWEEEGIKNRKKTEEFLNKYRFSSYPDYIGIKNFPSVINKKFLIEYFGNKKDYERFVREWTIEDLNKIKDLTLENSSK